MTLGARCWDSKAKVKRLGRGNARIFMARLVFAPVHSTRASSLVGQLGGYPLNSHIFQANHNFIKFYVILTCAEVFGALFQFFNRPLLSAICICI